jgi:hypothetical protein
MKIYRTIILTVVLHECETWSLILKEEHRTRVFENSVLRNILRPRKDEVTGSGEKYITRMFTVCTAHRILFGDQIKKNGSGGACSTYGRQERCIRGSGGRNLREKTIWKTHT